MLEAAGLEAVKKAGEAALNRAAEVNIQGELARQMAQQEAFRVGELSRPELKDIGALREREAAAAADIRGVLADTPAAEASRDLLSPGETSALSEPSTRTEGADVKGELHDPGRLEGVREHGLAEGGPYGDLSNKQGYEKHHMPADSTTQLEYEEGPCIRMEIADHRQTASWGNSREAREYRQEQRELVESGKFREAFDNDVQDVRDKFGDKYDAAISQADIYVEELQAKGRIS